MHRQLDLSEAPLSQRTDDMIGTYTLLGLLWEWLDALVYLLALLLRPSGAGIGWLVLGAPVVAGR